MRWRPFCAEKIQRAAVACKHCHRDLPPVVVEPKQRWSKRRMVVTWGIAAALGVGIYGSASGLGSTAAGTTAASGCIDAWDAISSFQAGTMSAAAAVSKMESAASVVRSAAADNPKYEPIAGWIVGAEAEVASGTPGANAGDLYAECGPGRR